MPPTTQDFQNELNRLFAAAQLTGRNNIDIKSGDLHRSVGDYPGTNHRMPICCDVMRKNIRSGDYVLSEPPKGKGATLLIRYKLPR